MTKQIDRERHEFNSAGPSEDVIGWAPVIPGAGQGHADSEEGRKLGPADLALAWKKYVELFEQPPHGTLAQMRALLELVPKKA